MTHEIASMWADILDGEVRAKGDGGWFVAEFLGCSDLKREVVYGTAKECFHAAVRHAVAEMEIRIE